MKKIFGRIPVVVVAVLAVGGVVLVLTAGLVGTSSSDALVGATSTKSVTLVQDGVVADLTFTPTVVGRSEIHALFTPPGGALQPVVSVVVRISLPAASIPSIPVKMVSIGANHWMGVVQVPSAGDWTMEVLVEPTANEQISFSTVVKIKK